MTIIQPGPNKADYPNANDTDGIKAWMRGAAAAAALNKTNITYQDWLGTTFNSWDVNYHNYHAELPAPNPPMGFVAQMSEDEFSYELIRGNEPCGPAPTFAPRVPVGSGPLRSTPTATALLIGPVGGTVTQQDGTKWVRIA